LKTLFL